ncbi:hypothetical protein ABPG75_010398 [Micractinium tetrahymenae]
MAGRAFPLAALLCCLLMAQRGRAIILGHASSIRPGETSASAGACALPRMAGHFDRFHAAINLQQAPDACGRCLWVRGPTGKAFIARVADDCPACAQGEVRLSPAAFKAVTGSEAGQHVVSWDWAASCDEPCSPTLSPASTTTTATLTAVGSRRLLGGASATKRALQRSDGQPGELTDWLLACQDGRQRCPSTFLASWGFQCANQEGDSCCLQPNGKDCTRLDDADRSECDDYSGCKWEGQFAALNGKQSKSWVKKTNIVSFFESPNSQNRKGWDRKWKNKTLRIRNPDTGKTLDVKVLDTCDDADCDGCCTQNANKNGGHLVDLEYYTAQRFWGSHIRGMAAIEFQVLD